jgi:tripartite-type tricarboxylate transporter receptor subunit TctC
MPDPRRWIIGIVVATGVAVAAHAQDYPSHPIRVVTSPPGGGPDLASRLVAPSLSSNIGQQVIIDNRPSGVIPGEIVARATPDGYTLLCATNLFTTGPLIAKTPYDPVTDFAPITFMTRAPNLLVVTASLPANSIAELISLAKAKPGALNYSAVGTGGTAELAMELFKSTAGVNIVRVPYSTISQESGDLLGGRVQMTVTSITSAAPNLQSGKLRALAITSLQPSPLFPSLPTVAASGAPGYEAVSVYGMYAPVRTPPAVVGKFNQELVRVLKRPDIKEKFLSAGQEVVAGGPEDLGRQVKSDIAKWAKVIKDAGIRHSD